MYIFIFLFLLSWSNYTDWLCIAIIRKSDLNSKLSLLVVGSYYVSLENSLNHLFFRCEEFQTSSSLQSGFFSMHWYRVAVGSRVEKKFSRILQDFSADQNSHGKCFLTHKCMHSLIQQVNEQFFFDLLIFLIFSSLASNFFSFHTKFHSIFNFSTHQLKLHSSLKFHIS